MEKTFDDFSLAPLLKENLRKANFITPTPIQADAIPSALEGKDVLGTAQTGTGKTLAFLVPIINKLLPLRSQGVEALVLLPTRELAMQVFDTLLKISRGSSMFTVLVVGGLSERNQLNLIRKGARVIIATPGRLDDYVKRRLVNLSNVKILVLDEADRMVDMGFLPQMKTILNVLPKERQTMCFSATLDRSVSHLVHDYLKQPVRVQIGSTDKPAERVDLQVYEVGSAQKLSLLVHVLKEYEGTCLVFARTKHGAEKLGRTLIKEGFQAGIIHGGRSQMQRNRALDSFKAGRHRVLVATDVASRGIHVSGIKHVINFDLPQTPQDFIHRVGRTGRVQEKGLASTFVTPQDRYQMRDIESLLGMRLKRMPLPTGLTGISSYAPVSATQRPTGQTRGYFSDHFVPRREFGGRKPRRQGGGHSSGRPQKRFARPINRRHNDT